MLNVDLVVVVEPAVAQDLRRGAGREHSAGAIAEAVRRAGHTLTPLHPQSAGDRLPRDMASQFVVTAPAGTGLDALAEHLRSLPGVAAAYVKPRDDTP